MEMSQTIQGAPKKKLTPMSASKPLRKPAKDWENEKKFIHAPAAVLDLFLFIHSCFREKWSDHALIDAAFTGYTGVEGSRRTIKGLKDSFSTITISSISVMSCAPSAGSMSLRR